MGDNGVLIAGVKQYLQAMVTMRQQMNENWLDGWRWPNVEDMLLKVGRSWTPSPLPSTLKYRPIKMCFLNALRLASVRKDLTYVEGYAGRHIPVHHAWCVDELGRVLDPTWKPATWKGELEREADWEYWGIPFRLSFVKRIAQTSGLYGVLFNWKVFDRVMTATEATFVDPRWQTRDGLTVWQPPCNPTCREGCHH